MEISNYNIEELDNIKDRLGKMLKNNENIKNNIREDNIKISLLNIDSEYRNKEPKNIYESNNIFLSENPIETKKGNNQIKIKFENHGMSVGDLITISNVESINLTLSNSLFLLNGLDYLIIKIPNHNIPTNYKDYITEIKIDINLVSEINSNNNPITQFYEMIPINMLIGPKNIFTFNDLVESYRNETLIESSSTFKLLQELLVNEGVELENIGNNYLFVKLDFHFITEKNELYRIPHTYNIKFMSLNGVPLYYINSDYPIDHNRRQGYQEITNIENDYIFIDVKSKSYLTGKGGGSHVSIFKIIRTIPGYPNAGEFTINLRNNFTNVVRIELVSSEFPFTDYVVEEGKNNKLYWQHLDDGDKIYEISIPSGNYNASNLIETMSTLMNQVERINSTPESRILNKFEIELNTFTNKIEFKGFSETILPNSITETQITIDGKEYFKLNIKHANNFVQKEDLITISNSEAIGQIPKSAVNTTHKIFDINKTDQTYSIILVPFNAITSTSNQKGGSSVKIKTASKIRLLFNKPDTLGEILGFKNVGNEQSITNFNPIINNIDDYAYPNNLDTVGNSSDRKTVLQLFGKTNYWLIYLNNVESVILNNGLDSCFAKVLLTGTQGDVIYNSFVNSPVEFEIPIPTISDINVKITNSKGEIIDFENTDFSFTIRVFELISKPKGTGKFSNDVSFIEEFIENIKRNNISDKNFLKNSKKI